jgi:hypothetical protein
MSGSRKPRSPVNIEQNRGVATASPKDSSRIGHEAGKHSGSPDERGHDLAPPAPRPPAKAKPAGEDG